MDEHIKSTIETYDKIASHYKLTATPKLRRREESSMAEFVKYLPGKKVLVPGCGDGRDSRYLTSRGLEVISIDLSKGMLEEAKKEDPQGSYQLYDMREIDKIGSLFDGIWASGCLYHLTKIEFQSFLENCKGILSKDGVLYLNMKEGAGEEYLDSPKSSGYPGGKKAKELLVGARFYSYYSYDELLSYFGHYEILKRRRLKYAEKVFEFWLRNK
jgi:SAM-dependent methyltransferase